jgi:hypothetical protein
VRSRGGVLSIIQFNYNSSFLKFAPFIEIWSGLLHIFDCYSKIYDWCNMCVICIYLSVCMYVTNEVNKKDFGAIL